MPTIYIWNENTHLSVVLGSIRTGWKDPNPNPTPLLLRVPSPLHPSNKVVFSQITPSTTEKKGKLAYRKAEKGGSVSFFLSFLFFFLQLMLSIFSSLLLSCHSSFSSYKIFGVSCFGLEPCLPFFFSSFSWNLLHVGLILMSVSAWHCLFAQESWIAFFFFLFVSGLYFSFLGFCFFLLEVSLHLNFLVIFRSGFCSINWKFLSLGFDFDFRDWKLTFLLYWVFCRFWVFSFLKFIYCSSFSVELWSSRFRFPLFFIIILENFWVFLSTSSVIPLILFSWF